MKHPYLNTKEVKHSKSKNAWNVIEMCRVGNMMCYNEKSEALDYAIV